MDTIQKKEEEKIKTEEQVEKETANTNTEKEITKEGDQKTG